MSPHRVGDLVDVAPAARVGRPNSAGGRGFIVKRSSSPTSVYDVEYVLNRKLSKEVTPDRLSPAMIETVARRRTRADADVDVDDIPIQPSLLSIHHQASQKLLSVSVTPSPPKRPRNSNLIKITTAVLLDQSRTWNGDDPAKHPILGYLRRNNNKDKGYLRRNDAIAAGIDPLKLKKQLSSDERNLVLRLRESLRGVVDFNQHGVTDLFAKAFGISKRTLQDWEKKSDQSRKQRSDAGTNLLTSVKLQDNWFSAYNCFKKWYRRQKQSDMDTLLGDNSEINDDRLFDLWNGIMSDEDRKPYIEMSKRFKERAPFLPGEITTILHNTQGSVTWRQIETALSSEDGVPIISEGTIRTIFMGLPGSEYTSTKLLPALTTAHIIKRKLWCQQFWIFWDSARLIRKRILLVHMDEKWFFTVVVRLNNKLVPFLGMEKSDSCRSVHHKNYLSKLLCIATTVYLTKNNNITAGGQGIHGTVVRAGHMLPAKATTYKRVTDPVTGKISYPKIAGNESRIAGQSYFEPAEITANTREVRGKRKFSLQHDYWPVIFNFLEALCRRLRAETGQDFVVLYQWDGAGPHAKKELITWLDKEFRIERGWIIRNQASQSPHLQVHDTSLFPGLSKYVSALQGVGNGSRDLDELWELVQQAYYNMLTPEVIARAFAHHVQIVNAIYSCNGGDGYHRNGGLHCGVRKAYAPKYKLDDNGEPIGEPIGVELIETPDEETKTLRYDRPTTEELDLVEWNTDLFNRSQLEFLVNNLPYESPEYLLAETALQGMD